MGERDPGVAAAPVPPSRVWRVLLAVALAALLAVALVLGPPAPAPDTAAPALVGRLLDGAATTLAGERGRAALGVILLALAAAAACRPLERRLGAAGPLLLALLIFGSGCWVLAWTGGAAVAPLAVAVAAFALSYGGGEGEVPAEIYRPPEETRRGVARWTVVGLLLAELVPGSPLAAGLLLPAALAVPRQRRRALQPFLVIGFACGLGLELLVQGADVVSEPIALAVRSVSLDPALIGSGLLSLLLGRNVGLLVGFAPVLLVLAAGRGGAARPALAATALAVPLLGALVWPRDFAAGWLNLQFLPVYGALWHLPAVRPRPWQWVAVALLAGLSTWPLWLMPRAALADGGAGLGDGWPRRQLPYEVTLRGAPHRGEALLAGGRVSVRAVGGCRPLDESGRFEMAGPGPAILRLAAPADLGMIALELGPSAPSSFEVGGAAAGRTVFSPDGRVGFEVLLSAPRGRFRPGPSEAPLAVHLIELQLAAGDDTRPLRFRLLAAAQP